MGHVVTGGPLCIRRGRRCGRVAGRRSSARCTRLRRLRPRGEPAKVHAPAFNSSTARHCRSAFSRRLRDGASVNDRRQRDSDEPRVFPTACAGVLMGGSASLMPGSTTSTIGSQMVVPTSRIFGAIRRRHYRLGFRANSVGAGDRRRGAITDRNKADPDRRSRAQKHAHQARTKMPLQYCSRAILTHNKRADAADLIRAAE